ATIPQSPSVTAPFTQGSLMCTSKTPAHFSCRSDHQQTPGRGLEREVTPSPFSIDFGGMHVKIARFHKAQRLKTLPLPDRRPEIPQDFRRSAFPSKKVLF
ncbi:MAG: hypothetical protein IJB99_08405, partial [Clostridia bacterium]|nr:hypothetical protein [Clostridia bacterium]